MKDIRMWEFRPTTNGRSCLVGVVQGVKPGTPPGCCGLLVDLTIRTGPIRRISEIKGQTHVVTESGSIYRLDGPSRPDLIREGLRVMSTERV